MSEPRHNPRIVSLTATPASGMLANATVAFVAFSHAGFAMEHNQEDTVACPVCGEAMRLLTVRKPGPDEETLVLQCRPCGLSTTKTRKCDAAEIIPD